MNRRYFDSYWDAKSNELTTWSFDSNNELHVETEVRMPYIYVSSPTPGQEGRKSIYGQHVVKKMFPNRYAMSKVLKGLDKDEWPLVHENGFVPPEMPIIADMFDDDLTFVPDVKKSYIDIEVFSEKGFPFADIADWPVTCCTFCREWDDDRITVYGCKPLSDKQIRVLPDGAEYSYCPNEAVLLLGILHEINQTHILSGWNSNQYDIPYLINRMSKLSKDKSLDRRLRDAMHDGMDSVTIPGASSMYKSYDTQEKRDKFHPRIPGKGLLDLLALYKKYSYIKLPSYKLDYVGISEFGAGKLKAYCDGGSKELSLNTMFRDHWSAYVAYNIRDVVLTRDIDRKRRLTDLAMTINGISRIPVDRVVYMSAIIDGALLKFMRRKGMVAPGRGNHDKTKFKGGYVKIPMDVFSRGSRLYRHSSCFDVTSEYPSVVCKLNVSPETYIGRIALPIFDDNLTAALIRDADDLLPSDDEIVRIDVFDRKTFSMTAGEIREKWNNGEWNISSDGVLFKNRPEGVFAEFTDENFAERRVAKTEHKKHASLYDSTGDSASAVLRDRFKTEDAGRKLILNSGYGQTGSRFSRLYNPHIAQAITSTGQSVVLNGERFVNEFFVSGWHAHAADILDFVQKYNPAIESVPFWDSSIEDRVVTMDTDSIIMAADDIVHAVFEGQSLEFNAEDGGRALKSLDFLNVFLNTFVVQSLNRYLNEDFAPRRLKSNRPFAIKFELEGEKTSLGSLFLKKKKYILRLPKMVDNKWTYTLRVTGFEMKKVNTPKAIADGIESFVDDIFEHAHDWASGRDGFYDGVTRAVNLIHDMTADATPQEVMHRLANSTSVNNIEKNMPDDGNFLFAKGAPFHVKGAILHNFLVKQLGLNIPLIESGDRAMIVRIREEVPKATSIAFQEEFPPEFLPYVKPDIYTVAETHFLNKLGMLFDAFGSADEWSTLLKKLKKMNPDWITTGGIDRAVIETMDLTSTRRKKALDDDADVPLIEEDDMYEVPGPSDTDAYTGPRVRLTEVGHDF